ncbi:GNAT family N-acetyltransferase [Flavobacterium litorale]|uniref:GNAT family N-acetyltransferase n=1 Tax=Flavobacterium litorale TaxID=2856519 RepID=A0ABX8V448_9FLAO|nr:GNAT family protein [Flavobacterium litorale]QYJ67620.1 GNAT family N-acetyltransferase [Flavobacterium litorale]
MTFTTLHTSRLTLRVITPEAYNHIYTTYSDEAIMYTLGIPNAAALKQEKEKFYKGVTTYNRAFVHFYLVDATTDKVIGWCGYHTWYTDHNRAEIGYSLFDEDYKCKGHMSEVLPMALQYGFEVMNLYRIEALVSPENVPSLKLLNATGFVKEGHLREHYNHNGVMEDSLIYALLQHEYKP